MGITLRLGIAMPWYCIYLPSQPSSKVWAWTLVSLIRESHQKAGEPADSMVYHAFTDDGHNLFYFSPESERVFHDILKFFSATERVKPLFVETLTPVLGPNSPQTEEWWANNTNSQIEGRQEPADNIEGLVPSIKGT